LLEVLIYHAGQLVGVSEESNNKVELEVGFVLMIVTRDMFLGGVGNDKWSEVRCGVDNVSKHGLDAVYEVGSEGSVE
jgi:hypothetical protein